MELSGWTSAVDEKLAGSVLFCFLRTLLPLSTSCSVPVVVSACLLLSLQNSTGPNGVVLALMSMCITQETTDAESRSKRQNDQCVSKTYAVSCNAATNERPLQGKLSLSHLPRHEDIWLIEEQQLHQNNAHMSSNEKSSIKLLLSL